MKSILNKFKSLMSFGLTSDVEHNPNPIFSVRHATASVTNYEKLYAQNYYAHQSGSTSYEVEQFPLSLQKLAGEIGVESLLDIGGGNGTLSRIWRGFGGKAASLDYYDNPEDFCKKFDLSHYAVDETNDIQPFIKENLGDSWISTCLDVAEHIDNEHLADFLLNLKSIIGKALVISISTRPSSQSNSFHSSVLPIETWKELFKLAGFEVYSDTYFDELIRNARYNGTGADIISVSHWQRINAFRDIKNHQHYLVIRNDGLQLPPIMDLREKVAEYLDIAYRWHKRSLERVYPELTYSVHFVQDWSFLRSIMDVWPSDRLRVTLRSDCISESYQNVIRGFLTQKGIEYTTLRTVDDAVALITPSSNASRLWVTATEGNHSITHQLNSITMSMARDAGFHTVSLQHGMTIASSLSPSSEFIGVWDEGAKVTMSSAISIANCHTIEVLGSPKFLDARLHQTINAIPHRFGEWTCRYKKHILVALNLHWSVHRYGSDDTYSWISRILENNKDHLFFIKPHPDDNSIYDFIASTDAENVILVDDILLTSIDWPLMRLVKAVDGVITTHSTLILDALISGTPVVRLPVEEERISSDVIRLASFPFKNFSSIPTITSEEWINGNLPRALSVPALTLPDNYRVNYSFFDSLIQIANHSSSELSKEAKQSLAEAIASSMQYVNLNQNPHKNIASIDEAMERFLN